MKTKDTEFDAAQETWEEKTAIYEKRLAEPRQQLIDRSKNLSGIDS